MKKFYILIFSIILSVPAFKSQASEWKILPFSIGTVLDQTELNDTLYILTCTSYNGTYQISSFDGNTIIPVINFNCVLSCYYAMSIQAYQNKLFIGGAFTSLNGDTAMNYLTYLENGSFHQAGGGMLEVPNGNISDLEIYNGTLLVAGAYRLKNFTYTYYKKDFLTYFDGSSWSKLSTDEFSYWCYSTCVVSEITINGSDIFVQGEFDYIGNLPIHSIALYHNGNWIDMSDSIDNFLSSPRIIIYGGDTISANAKWSANYTEFSSYIKKWNGGQWQTIKKIGKDSLIYDIISFNNQLFISVNSEIFTVNPIDGTLTPSLDTSGIYYVASKFFVYKSKLYCSTYYFGDPQTDLALAVFSEAEVTQVSSAKTLDDFVLYPNPASTMLFLDRNPWETCNFEILDISGRVKMNFSELGQGGLDIRNLEDGQYLIKIEKEGKYLYRRFIKSN